MSYLGAVIVRVLHNGYLSSTHKNTKFNLKWFTYHMFWDEKDVVKLIGSKYARRATKAVNKASGVSAAAEKR